MTRNIVSIATGEPMLSLTQEIVAGIYVETDPKVVARRSLKSWVL